MRGIKNMKLKSGHPIGHLVKFKVRCKESFKW